MREAYGDIWEMAEEEAESVDAVVITTNGFVKKDGTCVMGRGIAQQARDRFPGLDMAVGTHLTENGNIAAVFDVPAPWSIMTMPVKPAYGAKWEPGWLVKADINLIQESAQMLVQLADIWEMDGNILVPRPGCGNGQLDWNDVKPVIEPFFDERFLVMHVEGIR